MIFNLEAKAREELFALILITRFSSYHSRTVSDLDLLSGLQSLPRRDRHHVVARIQRRGGDDQPPELARPRSELRGFSLRNYKLRRHNEWLHLSDHRRAFHTAFGMENKIERVNENFHFSLFETQSTIEEWKYVFWIGAAAYIVPAVIFVFLGSGEVQKWNEPKKKDDDEAVDTKL